MNDQTNTDDRFAKALAEIAFGLATGAILAALVSVAVRVGSRRRNPSNANLELAAEVIPAAPLAPELAAELAELGAADELAPELAAELGTTTAAKEPTP